jgi:N-acetylglutamate synthase-like GNAT family acetyltransferase
VSEIVVGPLIDVEAMRRLGVDCGLEDAGRDDESIVAAWGAWDGSRLVGAIALERQGDLDTPEWLAVDERYRRRGIAGRLYAALEDEARRRTIRRLWVTARSPGFFVAHGFVAVDDAEVRAMLLGGCLECDQYGHGCEPQAMTKRLEDAGLRDR